MEQTNEAIANLLQQEQKDQEAKDIKRIVDARLQLIASVVRCEADRWARATDPEYKPPHGSGVYLAHIDDCADELSSILRESVKMANDTQAEETRQRVKPILFDPVWMAIKDWDIERSRGEGYSGSTGTDVGIILHSLEPIIRQLCQETAGAVSAIFMEKHPHDVMPSEECMAAVDRVLSGVGLDGK